ncbi:MAG: hypothetical protein E7353_07135 [Clostridiales bacterium]|nr:hypothetical protein [Clostridiales bacterium]
MNEICLDGEVYYYDSDKAVFFDENFMIPSRPIIQKLAESYFLSIDTTTLSDENLISLIKQTKKTEAYKITIKLCEIAFRTRIDELSMLRIILPIYNSACRNAGYVKEGLETTLHYYRLFKVDSSVLFTTIGSSYCDLGDYDNALKFANKAYAMQGGGVGYNNELSLLYKRIKKLSPSHSNLND